MNDPLKTQIENRLKELAAASDISNVDLEWGPSDFQLGPGAGIQRAGPTQHPLAVTIGTNRKVLKFTQDELNDCSLPGPQGDEAWHRLEHRLKDFLKKFQCKNTGQAFDAGWSKPRMGFESLNLL